MVNLIRYNPIPSLDLKAPSEESILKFQKKLIDQGVMVTRRNVKGEDILAACGQLNTKH